MRPNRSSDPFRPGQSDPPAHPTSPVQLPPPDAVIRFLRTNVLRTRVGLWLMPPHALGSERLEAIRLGIDAADLRDAMLRMLEPGTRFLHIDKPLLNRLLDTVANAPGNGVVLVYNLDLLLAALDRATCTAWWEWLSEGMPHRRRALLLGMPAAASHLLPDESLLNSWQGENRLAGPSPYTQENPHGYDR